MPSMKYFSLRQQWVLLVIALLLLGSLWFRFLYHPPSPSPERLVEEVVIEVSGAVRSPGVYLFNNPPTLREAVERAGGLKETAWCDTLSSSEILKTGTLLTVTKESSQIPSHPSPLPSGEKIGIKVDRMATNKLLVFSIPLDLNRVSMEDLCLISGVGESLAREIVAYRERRRGFRSAEELKNVKGIGEKKWNTMKKFFTVAQPSRVDSTELKP